MTATATDPNGNTSEFSQEFGGDKPPTAVIGFTSLTVNEGVDPVRRHRVDRSRGHPLTYSWSFGDGDGDGPEPIHIYTAPGTITSRLTVNDGFGGIEHRDGHDHGRRRARRSFIPNAFTPPLTFTTPDAGDGFGESVASMPATWRSAPVRATRRPARSTSTTASHRRRRVDDRTLTASSSTSSPTRTPSRR